MAKELATSFSLSNTFSLDVILLQTNVNGQPAWTYDDTRKEFYYHTYSKHMPDLNLSNADVVARLDVSRSVALLGGRSPSWIMQLFVPRARHSIACI